MSDKYSLGPRYQTIDGVASSSGSRAGVDELQPPGAGGCGMSECLNDGEVSQAYTPRPSYGGRDGPSWGLTR
jgi:hypothetical protein